MSKRAVLRLDGQLEQGFRVMLEIGEENLPASTEAIGALPASPELIDALAQWHLSYREGLNSTRLSVKRVAVASGLLAKISDCQRSAQHLQTVLRTWLSSPSFYPIDLRLRETLKLDDSIRLVLRTTDLRLHHLPWHHWNFLERYTQAELVLGAAPDRLDLPPRPASAVQILAILGNSQGIDVESDRAILSALPNTEVCLLVQPSRQELNHHLWDRAWDILFFAGHSETAEGAGRLFLNAHESLTLRDLEYAMQRAIAKGLRLAIFNSCDGLGLAYELEALRLPHLIVMREPVPDQVAQEFLKRLLMSFSQGSPLHFAVRQAREWLQGLEGTYPAASWLPVLVQNPFIHSLLWSDFVTSPIEPLPSAPAIAPSPAANPPPSPAKRRKSARKLNLRAVFAMSLLVAIVLTGVRLLGWLEPAELWAYDQLLQWQPASEPDPRLVLVLAKKSDRDQFGQPLRDEVLARVLQRIEQFQPKVIGLDIFRDVPTSKGWKNLTQVLQHSPALVPICSVGEVDGTFDPEIAIALPPGIPAAQGGFADGLVPDRDGRVRRYALRMGSRPASLCQSDSSFSYQIVHRYLGAPPLLHLPTLQPDLGGYALKPADATGTQLLVRYRPADQLARQVSLNYLLSSPDADLKTLLQGHIVLIGYAFEEDLHVTKLGKREDDVHATPIGNMYGVMVHAQVVSQLLRHLEQREPFITSVPEWLKMAASVLFAFMGGWMAWRWQLWAVGLPIVVAVECTGLWIGWNCGIWLPVVRLLASSLIAACAIAGTQWYLRQAESVTHAAGKRVN